MKNRTILLICFLIIITGCSSGPDVRIEEPEVVIEKPVVQAIKPVGVIRTLEETVILLDSFNNNDNQWKTGREEFVHYDLDQGNYVFEHLYFDAGAFSSIPLDITDSDNFIMESCIKKIGGKGECSYGLTWGMDNEEQNSHFAILHYDYCLYGIKVDSRWKTMVNWRRSGYINDNPEHNKLTIKKQGNKLEIFVNEQLIIKTHAKPLFGSHFGFIIFGNIRVNIDYILLTKYIVKESRGEMITLARPEEYDRLDYSNLVLNVQPDHEYLFIRPEEYAE